MDNKKFSKMFFQVVNNYGVSIYLNNYRLILNSELT